MNENYQLLQNLPLLQFLPSEFQDLIMDSFEPASFTFGNTIVEEGQQAEGFYIVVSGRARVVKEVKSGEEISLHTLRPGDSFGEMGILDNNICKATVRASGNLELLRLDSSVFKALLKSNPEIRKYFELQIKHRSLHNFFRLYSPFAQLPTDALKVILTELETVSASSGELVIREGDNPGPMYVVEEGRLRVFNQENGHRQYRAYLRKGDFFGEISLFKSLKRTASVEAISASKLLMLSEITFRKLLTSYPEFKKKIEERIAQYDYKHVARVPLDFTEEILPSEIVRQEKVGSDQVDHLETSADEEKHQDAPFASIEGYFTKKEKKIRRFPHVMQIDAMDCGAACLAIICRYFGKKVNITRIRQLVHVGIDGTSLKALTLAGIELGLASRSVKASKGRLTQMPLPAIVHWEGNHWVVLYDVEKKFVRIADPGIGRRRIRLKEFEEKWSGYAALFDYTQEFRNVPETRTRLAWIAPFFQPHTSLLSRALALAIIVSALQMVLPIFTQVIVDKVLVEQDTGLLHILILSMVAVLIFMTLAMIVQRYLLSFSAVRIDSHMLDYLTQKLLALPMSYFNTRRTGDIQRRIEGLRWLREFFSRNFITGLTALVQLSAALTVMFLYSPSLAFVFLAVAPVYAGLMIFSKRRLRPVFDDMEEAFGRYNSHQIDAIKGIETVKAMGAETKFRETMLSQFHNLASRLFRADFTIMTYEGAIQMVTFLSVALFLWFGAHQVMKGTLTVGALVAFNSLVALANGPIGMLLSLWDSVQMGDILINRLNDVVEQEPEQGTDRSRLIPVWTLEGRIRLQKLTFRYGGPDAPNILDGIDLDISPGMKIALVGRSGSGKTTLVKCLAGLLEPTEGTIYYDGIDIRTLNYRDLRRKIGYVLQDNFLFDDTIANNVAFGDREPDMDRVLWASRAANAHEFVERLPLGYETKIGESGIALSGGQRQRIAIARALYLQPPVLIFDEATSSLDTESERAVKENIDRFLEKRTSILIAHRLSTVRDADLIAVLEKGKLVEIGNHAQLMDRHGLYFYLVSQQLSL